MLFFPAIDLMGGEVVRLQRGEAERKTVYSSDPAAVAREWEARGGDWIHVVDLDAAFHGTARNLESVRAITQAVGVPCQLGGGIRTREAAAAAFEAGVGRVVVGTRALESIDFVGELSREFGSERVAVGIDARDGRVAVKGWTETSEMSALELARLAEQAGAGVIIYTDIATDGMLTGPDFRGLEAMLQTVNCRIIASGGVSGPEDLRQLSRMEGLHGAIIGRALYEGRIEGNLRQILAEG